jgi:hypothetical protein
MSHFNPADHIANRLAKTTYVIVLKDQQGKLTLLADPGLGRPWSAGGPNPLRNQKTAEFHAKNCDGMACTWEEAFRLLQKEDPGFEKKLYDQLKTKAKILDAQIFKNQRTGQLIDKHGNPIPPANPQS